MSMAGNQMQSPALIKQPATASQGMKLEDVLQYANVYADRSIQISERSENAMRKRARQTWSLSALDAPKTAFNAHWRENQAIYISVFQAMPQPEFGVQRVEYMRIITQAYVDNYIMNARNAQTPPTQLNASHAGYDVKRELGSPVGDMLHGDWVKAE